MNVKKFILLVFLISIAGCGGPTIKPFVSDFVIQDETSFTLIDKRNPAVNLPQKGSYNRTACDYGIMRIGNSEVVPDRVDYLRTRLENEIGPEKLEGKIIFLNQFDLYFNYQLPMRADLGGMNLNLDEENIVAFVNDIFKKFECWADETYPGGYDLGKNTELQPVGIGEILVDIGESSIKSRVEFIPGAQEQNQAIGGTTIIRAVDKLIDKIESEL